VSVQTLSPVRVRFAPEPLMTPAKVWFAVSGTASSAAALRATVVPAPVASAALRLRRVTSSSAVASSAAVPSSVTLPEADRMSSVAPSVASPRTSFWSPVARVSPLYFWAVSRV